MVANDLDIPIHLVQSVVAVEDKRFWSHPGFDPIGAGRALAMLLLRHGRLQGASTIPEQLAKLRRDSSRTLRARLRRAATGIWLCSRHSKVELLEWYLSSVYLGRQLFGVHAAAVAYFGFSANKLNPAQSFFLADRIALPNRVRPTRVANLLSRKTLRTILGDRFSILPEVYAGPFGPRARQEIEAVINILGK